MSILRIAPAVLFASVFASTTTITPATPKVTGPTPALSAPIKIASNSTTASTHSLLAQPTTSSAKSTSISPTTSSTTIAPISNIASSTSSLAIHAEPSTSSPVIAQINPNNGVTVLPNNWIKVVDAQTNTTGWVTQVELNSALKHDNLTIKTISTSPNGSSVTEFSQIKTGAAASAEYQAVMHEVQFQHQQMNQNFERAMQQLRQLETDLFSHSNSLNAPSGPSKRGITTASASAPTANKQQPSWFSWYKKVPNNSGSTATISTH